MAKKTPEMENKIPKILRKSFRRGNSTKNETTTPAARTRSSAPASIVENEATIVRIVREYLDRRQGEKTKEKKYGRIIIYLLITHILITIGIFYVQADIDKTNKEYIEMKKKATIEMVEQYKAYLEKQQQALKDWEHDRNKNR